MISPLRKINPSPFPPAIPKSASLASPGPFTTQPMTANFNDHYLPLGMRVLSKIENIVREEMNNFGCQELLMPIVQPAELWQETGRWNALHNRIFHNILQYSRRFPPRP